MTRPACGQQDHQDGTMVLEAPRPIIGSAALFLASDEAAFLTGVVLEVGRCV